jgi:hypothetical protein
MKLLIFITVGMVLNGHPAGRNEAAPVWQTQARLHRLPKRPISGTLAIDHRGLEFRSGKFSRRWSFADEIHTFDLADRDLTVTIYESRPWHEPGERRFHFRLNESMPPSVASMFAEEVRRPVRNGAPDASAPAIAEIPAYHPKRFGGSNGTLRFTNTGIDYVSENSRDSHSWRWSEIQTIANPNPYSFRVTAYRDIDEFELKQPLSRELFDRLWERLYAGDLNLGIGGGRR